MTKVNNNRKVAKINSNNSIIIEILIKNLAKRKNIKNLAQSKNLICIRIFLKFTRFKNLTKFRIFKVSSFLNSNTRLVYI